VLLLSHSSLLSVHLLKSFVFSKLLGHFQFEVIFHSAFLVKTFSLQFHLIVLGGLQLLLLSKSLLELGSFRISCSFFLFLYLKVVSHVFYIISLSLSSSFLVSKLLKDRVTLCLSSLFHGLKLIRSSLLLSIIPPNKFFLVLLKLSLSLNQCFLFIDRKNHILF